jgi:hypothetical protein
MQTERNFGSADDPSFLYIDIRSPRVPILKIIFGSFDPDRMHFEHASDERTNAGIDLENQTN